MTKTKTITTSWFILLLLVVPVLARAMVDTVETVRPEDPSVGNQEDLQQPVGPVRVSQPDTAQEAMCPAPWRSMPIQMGSFPNASPEPNTDGPADRFLNLDVEAIADRLAAENNEEQPIRDAFVHGPDELDDLAAPIAFKDAVDYYIAYFTVRKRKMFASWLRRARRYVPRLRAILRQHDLPEDLVYLAMIESGFNPKAYSRAKACGPWQFISATGARYGLRIDHWVDERRDFEKATVAAALYLKDLFDRFGCWYLAASGYNAGEGRIERAIKRHGTTNYWQIYKYNTLPRETRHYIPQLIAAATISENPEKYGFSDDLPEETPEYEYHVRDVPPGTPLHLVAQASLTELSEIKSLNPELLTGITPPGKKSYALKLPEDASLDRFAQTLNAQLTGKRVVRTVRVLSPRRKRSLTKLLKRYGTTRSELALVNRGGLFHRGHIYVPVFDCEPAGAEKTTRRVTSHRSKKASLSRLSKTSRHGPRVLTSRRHLKLTSHVRVAKKKARKEKQKPKTVQGIRVMRHRGTR